MADASAVIHDDLGGRWSSLTDREGREWLWSRWSDDRFNPVAGGPFIDVGGVEECFPTITGHPDHGGIWSQRWHSDGDWRVAEYEDTSFRRRVSRRSSGFDVDYEVAGRAGYRFLWAFHALLAPDEGTRILAPVGHPAVAYPFDVTREDTSWPDVLGQDGFDVLGPDDGTALFCGLPGLSELTVVHGSHRITFRLEVSDQPHGFGVWRNLGGYPWDDEKARFRNFGIEPMLGAALDRDQAADCELAVLPSSGRVSWRLCIDV